MDIQKLRAFMCVAKYQSFTKAAVELFISQPALSKKISDFEKELGTTLFIRDNRVVELTAAGKLLYNEAPVLLKYGDDLENKVRMMGVNPDTKLSIGCTGIEYGRLMHLLYRFREQHPEISLSMHRYTAAEIRKCIVGDLIDIAFQTKFEVDLESNVDSIQFDVDDLAVVVSKFHPLAAEQEITMNQLKGENYIGIQPTTDHIPFVRMIDMIAENGFEPKSIMIAKNVGEMILNVAAGVAVGHLFGQTQNVYGGLVSYLKTSDYRIKLEINMVWNNANKNKARKKFVDFVREENKKIGLE